jgi:hypothetical protein
VYSLDFTAELLDRKVVEQRRQGARERAPGAWRDARDRGLAVILLTLGNPEGVKIEVNGHAFPLQAPAGKVLHDLRIDLETAKGLGG